MVYLKFGREAVRLLVACDRVVCHHLDQLDRMKIDIVSAEDRWSSAFPLVEDDSGRYPVI
jgi:hypothetical protein